MKAMTDCPTSDRTWPLPKQPWVMRMTWSELLFVHWPVDPPSVASLLPTGVTLDTRDGKAWVGVVPFLMSNVVPRFCPPIPGQSRFLELNVRTYVSVGGKPGVWFFSLDAASRVAVRVARATFNLPYMDAKMTIRHDEGGTVHYRSTRTHRGEPTRWVMVLVFPSRANRICFWRSRLMYRLGRLRPRLVNEFDNAAESFSHRRHPDHRCIVGGVRSLAGRESSCYGDEAS
jgi:hypothetical protein